MKKKVVVGMSGGVDSSVAAYLLKEQGYEVIGVTMKLWQEEDACSLSENGGCCGLSGIEDARRVAEELGIPHYVMNFKEEFRTNVVDYFIGEYLNGRTPNPCNACNRHVKWEALLKRSLEIGADYIATGHYARIEQLSNGRYSIRNSVTAKKDQTYALYNLTQEQLSHTLMPVGDYEKSQIREIAEKAGLIVAGKKDSQDICFIPDGDYARFVNEYANSPIPPKGNYVTKDGIVLGEHEGITHYTIGQRKGLGIATGHPVFVTEIRSDRNEVVIGENEELFSQDLICKDFNYMAIDNITKPIQAIGKIRYSHKGTPCTLKKQEDGNIHCHFEEAVRAITPGQAAVFYLGDHVLGGGIII